MTKDEYKKYLLSDHWKKTRVKALKRCNYQCVICESGRSLQVHHLMYDRLGKELDTDLIVLCGKCHKLIHNIKS